jgi:uncharacterized protein (TIGR02145 family)
MKHIYIIPLLLLAALSIKSQVINVCGTDTIKLQLENYENGTINWQESADMINWITIPNETGPEYIFFPAEEKYYRAMIKTTECNPLYSPISFVQLPPFANAGTDRFVGIETIKLLGSDTLNCIGEWSLLSGSGTIHEPQNPTSEFTFSTDTAINLLWTLTNTCGESSDTIHLSYDPLETIGNYIIVDNTDFIYSDSLQMAEGIYIIKFSDPEITPTDSAVLIAMREDISFLQIVKSFTYQDSIYHFITEQGTLEDIFSGGVFNMGEAVNESMVNEDGSYLKGSVGFPTRETIRSLKGNHELSILYIDTKIDERYPCSMNKTYAGKSGPFVINLPDIPIFQSSAVFLGISESFVSLDPNFVVDLKFKWFKLKNLKIGVDNAEFKYGYNTGLEVNGTFTFEKDTSIFNVSKRIWFAIGGFPVMVQTDFDIVAGFEAEASANMLFEREVLNTRNFTALVQGSPGHLYLTTASSNSKEENFNCELSGNLSSVLKIGPQVSFMVYGAIGPYIDVPIKAEADLCAAGDPFDEFYWHAHAGLGIEGNIGAKGEFFGKTLFDFSFNVFDCPLGPQIDIPYELEILSGNYQSGTVGEQLAHPVVVKVKSSLGFAVPFVQVHVDLEDGNGSTEDHILWSDINGLVSIDWELGSNPLNVMTVSSGDCDYANLEGSPLYIYANSEIPLHECMNSSLQLNMVLEGDNFVGTASGGEAPYLYSTDGLNYGTDIPMFSIYTPGQYTVYAQDALECQTARSFVIEPYNPCLYTGLTAFVYVEENTVEISATGGTLPYSYALDDPLSFSGENWYGFLSEGPHIAYVRSFVEEAIACMDSVEFEIPEGAISPLLPIYPEEGRYYIPVLDINFQWEAGNYAPDQIYDLYLDYGGGMTLIASDLETESYFYAGPIPYFYQVCDWKIVVKDQAGNPKDEATFSFTTGKENPGVPDPATLMFPMNTRAINTLSVDLQWIDQPDDFVYDVYFDDTDASTLSALNHADPPYSIDNLQQLQTYYWKVVTKSIETGETAESAVFSFSVDTSLVGDYDGNTYHPVVIGTQTWLKENLRTLHFNDGTPIENITDYGLWIGTTAPAYAWFQNDSITYNDYGPLYNWWTVDALSNGYNNVCPDGWHVPGRDEFIILRDYLGGASISGGKLKEAGLVHWAAPNTGATNESGFTALPGGRRYYNSDTEMSYSGYFWSTSENNEGGYYLEAYYNSEYTTIIDGSYWTDGKSIRCLKNE